MPTKRLALVGALLGIVATLVQASPAGALGRPIRITKIHYKQTGTNLDTEYIVFKNVTTWTVQMKGWKIVSAPSTDNQYYVFPRTAVKPGATLTLYTGKGTNTATRRYWGATSSRWNNDGDKAVLKNPSGTVIDTCQYAGGGTTAYC
jgi:hypothetical protein